MADKKVKAEVKKTVKVPKKAVAKEVPKTAVKKEASVKLSLKVVDFEGKSAGSVSLPEEIFNVKVSPKLISQAVRVYLANQRSGTAKAKTRGEVTGTTKKIYRQKGTGKARHGAKKAPIFRGGGITFGPVPHDFSLKLSQKMRQKALFAALSEKVKSEKILGVDAAGATGKTTQIQKALKVMGLTNKKGEANKVLFVTSAQDQEASRASRNIGGLTAVRAQSINIFEVMKSNYVVFAKNAIAELSATFLKK